MPHAHKLSLRAAILINLNIMVGVGIFLNTTVLASLAGAAGCISYLVLAILLLPLIVSIARLVHIYPEGGFYAYASKPLGTLWGFISTWSYFTSKLASSTLMIHASMQLLRQIIPALQAIPIFCLDFIVLSIFLLLNVLHMRSGRAIQFFFLSMKLIPILFVLISGLFLFNGDYYSAQHIVWDGFLTTLPLVLYTAVGFEATTSLSRNIQDAERNGPLAIIISYAIVITLNALYQFFFYGMLGSALATAGSFTQAFPLLIAQIFNNPTTANIMQGLCNCAIASSALGGAYGIMFSNSWNLYTLAEHNNVLKARWFTHMNRFQIPVLCIMAEGILSVIYLFVTQAHQTTLQQITSLGCTIAYTLSIIGLLAYERSRNQTSFVGMLALINCVALMAACVKSIYVGGFNGLVIYGAIVISGIIMYTYLERTRTAHE
jgi:amino acid transporter